MKKPSLEVVTNVTLIVFCVVVGSLLIRAHFFAPHAPAPLQTIQKGDQLEILHRIMPSQAPRTLFLALSPQCGFCNQSIPFYRRLLAERGHAGRRLPLVGVLASSAKIAEEKQLLTAAGVELDGWAVVDFSAARFPGTPTLVLLDDAGRVDEIWVGKLDPSAEESVVRRLQGPV